MLFEDTNIVNLKIGRRAKCRTNSCHGPQNAWPVVVAIVERQSVPEHRLMQINAMVTCFPGSPTWCLRHPCHLLPSNATHYFSPQSERSHVRTLQYLGARSISRVRFQHNFPRDWDQSTELVSHQASLAALGDFLGSRREQRSQRQWVRECIWPVGRVLCWKPCILLSEWGIRKRVVRWRFKSAVCMISQPVPK